MKKEVKKKEVKKRNKKDIKKDIKRDPSVDVTLGSLLVCVNSFSSELLIEKIFVLFGIMLIIEGTWKLYVDAKDNKKKYSKLYFATCILFIVVFTILIIGSFII